MSEKRNGDPVRGDGVDAELVEVRGNDYRSEVFPAAAPVSDRLLDSLEIKSMWGSRPSAGQVVMICISIVLGIVGALVTGSVCTIGREPYLADTLTKKQHLGFFLAYFAIGLGAFARLFPSYFGKVSVQGFTAVGEMAVYMLVMFVADRTSVLNRNELKDAPGLYWAAIFILGWIGVVTARAIGASGPTLLPIAVRREDGVGIESSGPTGVFPRDQLDEWKGLAIVLYLLETYLNPWGAPSPTPSNDAVTPSASLLLCVSVYIWATVYNTYLEFEGGDYSLAKLVRREWRASLLPWWVCILLGNQYVVYFLCAMHTIFVLLVYLVLCVRSSRINNRRWGMIGKFSVSFIGSAILWDITGVPERVWKPLKFMLGYSDPYRPFIHNPDPCNKNRHPYDEWDVRSGREHFLWIFTMVVAYNYARVNGWVERLDSIPSTRGNIIKGMTLCGVLTMLSAYGFILFSLSRDEYAAVHAYTSFIPVTLYLVLRNVTEGGRQYFSPVFAAVGKMSLELFVIHKHLWMVSMGSSMPAKDLLRILPFEWHFGNFIAMSVIFVLVAYRLRICANSIREFVVPAGSSNVAVVRNLCLTVAFLAFSWKIGSWTQARSVAHSK